MHTKQPFDWGQIDLYAIFFDSFGKLINNTLGALEKKHEKEDEKNIHANISTGI